MTDNTEPNYSDYLDRVSELNKLGYPELDGACNICGVHPDTLKALIADQVAKARGCTSCGKLTCDNCERLWQT